MKYSKLFVAGVAALALGGCYSMPSSSEAPQGSTGPVGYNDATTDTGGMTVDTGATGYTGPTGSAEIKGETGAAGAGTAGRMKGSADRAPGKTRPEYLDIIYSPMG